MQSRFPMHLCLDLTLPSSHEFVRTTRRVVASYLEDSGVEDNQATDLVLAIGEACTNVVQHAFPDGGGTFRLILDLRPEEIVVEVSDAGIGFEPFEQAIAPFGHLAVSGRGIEIMRRLVTTVEVESPTPLGGTRLRLLQRLGVPALHG
jgi:anti-sigma regulatory factor (Ser/Thr protein kinase)